MFEDNTVSELFDGHCDLGVPALNECVFDRECLCKSFSHTSSSYHDHRCRLAPLPDGHSSLQLTLTPSLDTPDKLVASCILVTEIQKTTRSGIISKVVA